MRLVVACLGYGLGLVALGMAHVSGWYFEWGDGPRSAAIFALSFAKFCISAHVLTKWRDSLKTSDVRG